MPVIARWPESRHSRDEDLARAPAATARVRHYGSGVRSPGDGSWIERCGGLCLTLIKAGSPSAIVLDLCGPQTREFASAEAAAEWTNDSATYDRTWLASGDENGWVFCWEDNGFGGADPDKARQLSAGTTYVSMFWNVNGVMSFTLAIDGQVVRQFDPLFHDEPSSPTLSVGSRFPLKWSLTGRQSLAAQAYDSSRPSAASLSATPAGYSGPECGSGVTRSEPASTDAGAHPRPRIPCVATIVALY
jgi:hypothetical protein